MALGQSVDIGDAGFDLSQLADRAALISHATNTWCATRFVLSHERVNEEVLVVHEDRVRRDAFVACAGL